MSIVLKMVADQKKLDAAKYLVMGSAEVVARKLEHAKRDAMGSDFRCHNGARGMIHKSKKDYKRVKRVDLRRGEW